MAVEAEDRELVAYYRARAPVYDSLYDNPFWEDDLSVLRAWLRAQAKGRSILEVAAGTGYWTAVAAPAAERILATDASPETLALAARRRPAGRVTFHRADVWALPDGLPGGPFDCAMAHLWWSHVRAERRHAFLAGLAARLAPGALLLMIDQREVLGQGGVPTRTDARGNRWERRRLPDGTAFELLKNYPDEAALRASLAPLCDAVELLWLGYFWAVAARFRA